MGQQYIDFLLSIVANLLGAFVGFVLALILERNTKSKILKEKINTIKKGVNEELSDISTSLNDYIVANQIVDQRITTPVWDAILNSGLILDFLDDKNYKNFITIYSLIKTYNDLLEKGKNSDCLLAMQEIINANKEIV